MKEIARILVGSQNYGLDIPESDKDCKVLLCPEFEDLYNYRKVEAKDLPEGLDKEHYSVMSVITFDKLLRNGNPNCLEMLYSTNIESDSSNFLIYVNQARELFRYGYLAIVWENFYNAVAGIIMNGFEKYGATRKTISRAIYFYGLICSLSKPYKDPSAYSMSAETWRNANITSLAKCFRTRSSITQGVLEETKDAVILLLKDEKIERQLKAHRWTEKNTEKVQELKRMSKCLEYSMMDLVEMVSFRD